MQSHKFAKKCVHLSHIQIFLDFFTQCSDKIEERKTIYKVLHLVATCETAHSFSFCGLTCIHAWIMNAVLCVAKDQ